MSSIQYPPQVRYALLPTRIERLARYGKTLGVEIWIKRDDETGLLLSGNKVRKLEFSLARALAEGVRGVVTCGGANSNHCRATTYLACRLGLESHLFLRTSDGRPPARLQGNSLLNRIAGAQIQWITPDEYRQRDERMRSYAERSAFEEGKPLFVIPEGASDPLGALGYVKAVAEIEEQLRSKNLRIDLVVHAMGSGGTTAGLVTGCLAHGARWRVVGVPVCDDGAYFRARVRSIREGLVSFGGPSPEDDGPLEIIEGYQGRGYGLSTPDELAWIRDFCRLEGILLDPCYTGKAFYGLHQEILKGRFPAGTRILFLHTGGIFANFDYGEEWQPVLDPECETRGSLF